MAQYRAPIDFSDEAIASAAIWHMEGLLSALNMAPSWRFISLKAG